MIPDSIVEEVRARADIVDIVGEHVPLKKAGKEYRALCPFHTEKTPSFYVVPAKGFYNCFGCGVSGDVFTFLMERLGVDFPDAVRMVAARVGVEVPEDAGPSPEQERNRPLYEAIAFAEDFYRRQLEGEAGARARRYLAERAVDGAAIERFAIGYAPDAWRALIEAAAAHGMDEALLLEAGLVKESERAAEPYDRLRDRVVFPIRDLGGRTIAFGGRVLGRAGEGSPKYLNSPETPIYHKGRVLYGLNWAKNAIRRDEAALVVEGYMDFVSLAARGVENVVAPLGTSMTEEQAELLARYARKVYLLYDSDAAGLRATFRSGDVLLRAGAHPLVATLPEGEDPDSLVRERGGAPLRKVLEGAVDVLERKLQILEEHHYFDDIQGTRRALDRLLPTLRAVVDPALRDLYIDTIARKTGIRRGTLEEELRQAPPRREAPAASAAGPGMPTRGEPGARRGEARGRAEATPGLAGQRQLLLLLLRDRAHIAGAAERLAVEDFTDPFYREIFAALIALPAPGPEDTGAPPVAALELGPEARSRMNDLLADPEELSEAERMFGGLVDDIRSERLHRRLDELDRLLPLAESKGDATALASYVRERLDLARELRGMQRQVERRVRKRGRDQRSGRLGR